MRRARRAGGVVLAMGALSLPTRAVSAQASAIPLLSAARAGGIDEAAGARHPRPAPVTFGVADGKPSPWWAPVASLALPGAGQFALKQPRSVAYLAAEAFLVIQYLAARRDGNGDRAAYRQLAADVARAPFGSVRPRGSWDYYETLEKFLESGAYDRVPGGSLDPETDASTYNGARWLLARQNFWLDPNVAPEPSSAAYQRAIAFYQSYAVRDEFRWSWRDAQLQQDLYRQTISSANRSYQRATNVLGIVAVNHLASLIDAYVSVRVRRFGGVRVGSLRVDDIETSLVLPSGATAPTPQLRIGVRAR